MFNQEKSMTSMTTTRLTVSLPVIVDFQGTLARGMTQNLNLQSLSFWSEYHPPIGTSVSALFHFSRHLAYLPLRGRVTTVTQDLSDGRPRFRIDISLLPLNDTEEHVLGLALLELESNLRYRDTQQDNTNSSAHANQTTDTPRSILSLFITDNPHCLPY